MRTRWLHVPALAALVLSWGTVPAQAADLPQNCTSDSGTITCDGDLKSGDVVEGTDGDDMITVKGNVPQGAVVRGGGGNDKITVYDVGVMVCPESPKPNEPGASAGKGGEVDGGDGDDTITVGGGTRPKSCQKPLPAELPPGNVSEGGKVLGGGGNDTITAGSLGYVKFDKKKPNEGSLVAGGDIDGGDGDDRITTTWIALAPTGLHGINGVHAGAGKDHIKVGGLAGSEVAGDAGDDTIEIGKANGFVLGGDGDDTIDYAGKWPVPGHDDIHSLIGIVNGGQGNDTMTVTEADGLFQFSGDQGDDKITAKDLRQGATVTGGDGDDTIKVENMNGLGGLPPVSTAWSSVHSQAGNDTIEIGLVGMGAFVDSGDGDDTISVKSVNGPDDKIRDWEDANDPLKNHAAVVQGWSGDDKITVGVLGKRGVVRADGYAPTHVGKPIEGKDTITVTTINEEGAVRGGPLADKITVTDAASENASIEGEDGDDMITVTGKAEGTVNGGPGKDTCKTKGKKVDCEGGDQQAREEPAAAIRPAPAGTSRR